MRKALNPIAYLLIALLANAIACPSCFTDAEALGQVLNDLPVTWLEVALLGTGQVWLLHRLCGAGFSLWRGLLAVAAIAAYTLALVLAFHYVFLWVLKGHAHESCAPCFLLRRSTMPFMAVPLLGAWYFLKEVWAVLRPATLSKGSLFCPSGCSFRPRG